MSPRPSLMTLPILALVLSGLPALAQTTANDGAAVDAGGQPPMVTTDAAFIRQAASGNLLEILSSEQAARRGQSAEIRDFAIRMVADHKAAGAALAKAAGQPALDATADPTAMLDPRHADLLATLDGAEAFDSAYVSLQRQAHEEAIALFQDYATNGEDGPVKEFAEATLPSLQPHLTAAQALPTP